ncbi:MAG TPA: flagellar hook-associated protein FlgL [Cellulomonas sp.]
MTAISRVTHMTVRNSTLGNLQTNLQKMAQMQAQLSSGKTINQASDDPAGASDILRLRGEQRQLAQFSRNADDGEAWLTTVDTALTTSLANLRKVRELTIQGGDGALGTNSRIALAEEIKGLRESLLKQSNTTYVGRSVFAGTTSGDAFAADGTYQGVTTSSVTRTVADGTTIRVDSNGQNVFGNGSTDPADSVFALLDEISATLEAGGDPTDRLTDIDTHLNNMLKELSAVGARENQIDTAQDQIADKQLTATTRLSSLEDVDLASAILDLQTQEVAYKGALGAAAKVLQPTLLDFLS